jgi:hypothetical protein
MRFVAYAELVIFVRVALGALLSVPVFLDVASSAGRD